MGEMVKVSDKKSDAKSEISISRTRQTEFSQPLNSFVDQIAHELVHTVQQGKGIQRQIQYFQKQEGKLSNKASVACR